MTEISQSRSRVSGPLFGATAASVHAGRLSYMIPRVPSIGSTITRISASASREPSGNTFGASRPCSSSSPSATSTSGVVRAHSRQKSSSTGSISASIA
jgi:hypothetical protein